MGSKQFQGNIIKPIFSIFTPVYNSEKYIKECIESVINQSFINFEWYIYDDGSTDSSYKICQEYALKDARINLSKGKNGNSVYEMNNFIDASHGEYIVFIDNDDYWDNDYLEKMYEMLKKSNADCAISSYTYIDHNSKRLDWYIQKFNKVEIIANSELRKRFLTTLEIEGFRWNKIYKSEILKQSGVKIRNRFPADIPWEYALFDKIKTAVLVNTNGYYYRQRYGSEVSSISLEKAKGMLDTFVEIADLAQKQGYIEEGWNYKVWRCINYLFFIIRDASLQKNEKNELFNDYLWTDITGKNVFFTIKDLRKHQKDCGFKFAIKVIVVRLVYFKYTKFVGNCKRE